MSNDNTQGGSEPSPASAGSRPVAWVVALGGDGLIIDGIFLRRTQAEEACAWRNEHTTYGARIIPLYEKPQTTLTDDERESLLFCYRAALPEAEKLGGNAGELCRMHRYTLRGLLKRLG